MGSGAIKVGGKTYTAQQWSRRQHPITKQPSSTTTTQKRTLAPKRMLPVAGGKKRTRVPSVTSTIPTAIKKRKRIEDVGRKAGNALRLRRRQLQEALKY